MKIEECLKYLDNERSRGSVYGLEAINLLLDRLHNPDLSLKIIHIAGTNGKGSVSSFLTNIIKTTYSVGTFNSPFVFSYNETYLINGKPVDDEILEKNLSIVINEVEKLKKEGQKFIPTAFEIEFATALMIFKNLKLDFAIIECGLGGKNDATNAIKNKLFSVITSISMDHENVLGNTLKEITEEKFGICIDYLVTYPQSCEIMSVLTKAKRLSLAKTPILQIANSSGQTFKYKFDSYKIQMHGEHQLINASIALCAIDLLKRFGYTISKADIKKGLFITKLSGRFEKFSYRDKIFIIDGAHNKAGAMALKKALAFHYSNYKKSYIFGCFKDKDYEAILSVMQEDATIHITKAPTSRGLEPSQLKNICEKHFNNVITNTSMTEAINDALNEQNDVIVIFGSLSILKEAKECIRGIINGHKED